MNAPRFFIWASASLILAAQLTARADGSDELAKLDPILGSWTSTGEIKSDDDEPVQFSSRWTAEKILENKHLMITGADNIGGREFRGISIISAGDGANQFLMTMYSSLFAQPARYRGHLESSVLTWVSLDDEQPNKVTMTLDFSDPKNLIGSIENRERRTGKTQSISSKSVKAKEKKTASKTVGD